MKICISLENRGSISYRAKLCVYFVDHVFAASLLSRFPTRIPSFSCLSATHATCINRTNGPVAVAQTDRTKHRQTLGGTRRGLKARPLMLCRRLAGISVEGNRMPSGELSLPLVRKAYIFAMYWAFWSFEDKAKQDWSLVLNPTNLP